MFFIALDDLIIKLVHLYWTDLSNKYSAGNLGVWAFLSNLDLWLKSCQMMLVCTFCACYALRTSWALHAFAKVGTGYTWWVWGTMWCKRVAVGWQQKQWNICTIWGRTIASLSSPWRFNHDMDVDIGIVLNQLVRCFSLCSMTVICFSS